MWRWFRHPGFIVGLALVFGGAYWFLHPRSAKPIGVGYVGERDVTLWNTLAQVRQPVADVHYGERLQLLQQEGPAMQVRTSSGTTGWILDSREMMDASLWQRSAELFDHARKLPVQALGHTNAISNVHIEPGRNTQRIYQFGRGARVAVLGRMVVADAQDPNQQNASPDEPAPNDHKSKFEDWLFVVRLPGPASAPAETALASAPANAPSTSSAVGAGPDSLAVAPSDSPSGTQPIAGWLLARFIDEDLPETVKDHASSAGMHPVAWFELNRVPDGSGGQAPQYLVAGARSSANQDCDFTMLQVYTWGAERMRYETAYVESGLCGKLPIRVSLSTHGPEFRFANAGDPADRTYVMEQTAVRRIRDGEPGPASPRTSANLHKHRHVPS